MGESQSGVRLIEAQDFLSNKEIQELQESRGVVVSCNFCVDKSQLLISLDLSLESVTTRDIIFRC